ncbi:carboxymuconolactone decarboxylase family protein [Paractinoplanes durhamensis]|uniref:Alkyl hydroperoxide reductase AhpD n=1 Tax=Paractinoplanes durhamensis TaxID=113563 RepID=A0ABQ3YU32_9ACTN|nr:carboxymuconolactone decarboxylase family protein [Actinoplanes durhamensis]GIE01083.1 alkyl hydroperoxide reductase AhpD [Actinoplanes durhamensis]
MRTERMADPVTLVAGAAAALDALGTAVADAGLDGRLLALCHLRASQINGCAHGVAQGVERAARHGAAADQLHAVAAWRDTPWFNAEERAALALTEAVTRMEPDPVPDRVWDVAATHFDQNELAALLLAIAITNAENRMDTSTRRQAGN